MAEPHFKSCPSTLHEEVAIDSCPFRLNQWVMGSDTLIRRLNLKSAGVFKRIRIKGINNPVQPVALKKASLFKLMIFLKPGEMGPEAKKK